MPKSPRKRPLPRPQLNALSDLLSVASPLPMPYFHSSVLWAIVDKGLVDIVGEHVSLTVLGKERALKRKENDRLRKPS